MRRAIAVILISVNLSQTGCAVVGEALIHAIFDSGKLKKGTSADKSLPKGKRRALYEEEFKDWMKEKSEERQRDQHRKKRRIEPEEWERSIDSAFPQR